MFTIKRVDANATKTPANYELMAYATMHDVKEQLKKLGAGNKRGWKYSKDVYVDIPAGGLILTAHSNKGCIYEVRALGLYGYETENAWRIEDTITALKGNARALEFVAALVKEITSRQGAR